FLAPMVELSLHRAFIERQEARANLGIESRVLREPVLAVALEPEIQQFGRLHRSHNASYGESAGAGNVALSPAARGQPGRLVSVGPGSACASAGGRQADPAFDRLFSLPLVPRDGARELRESGGRGAAEPRLRQHQ